MYEETDSEPGGFRAFSLVVDRWVAGLETVGFPKQIDHLLIPYSRQIDFKHIYIFRIIIFLQSVF